jgi:hypothetical protein
MKKVLLKIGLFISCVLVIIIVGMASLYYTIDSGNYYKLNKKYDNLIFGHSHTECAFNDSLINKTLNLSNSGENMFYTYFKIKKIVENNKVKNVFVSFTNNYIEYSSDTVEIWKERYLDKWYTKYGAYMNYEDVSILLKNNPRGLLNVQSITAKKYLTFLIRNKKSIITDLTWGAFRYSKRAKLDSLLKTKPVQDKMTSFRYSEYGLQYLDKIIKLCKENNVNVYLLRSPVHSSWDRSNEVYFQKLVHGRYSQIPFLDFCNYSLPTTYYGDRSHLNYKGARVFSVFFNDLLENGLLKKQNPQEFINQEMNKKSNL